MTKKFFCNVVTYFKEYCTRTSVHGFQYFGESKRTIFERIFWLFVFFLSLSACTLSIYAVYKKWESTPVIVNFANKATPIYEIPFPALTICPESKFSQKKFNFTEIMQRKEDDKNITETDEKNFNYMSLMCNYYSHLNYSSDDTFPDHFFEVLDDLTPELEYQNCSFLETGFICQEFFTRIITEVGVCQTFNMLNRNEIFRDSVVHFEDYHTVNKSSDWTLQNGYTPTAGLDVYPYRAFLAGANYGFTLNIVTPKENLDYACKDSIQGYRVLLHTPMTIPRPRHKYFRIPLDQNVIGAIQPVMITTSKRVKAYDPDKRRCYFSNERKLQYFKNYSASNCNLECLTNYTLLNCGCVNYYMPRENGTSICGTGNIKCMKNAEEVMQLIKLEIKLENATSFDGMDCHCLPICSDLTYEVETSQTDLNWQELLSARRSLPRISNRSHISSLRLFFKSENFITSERNELYGPLDFLANFGGILGLFTGFSVLSLVELLYFLSVRIICNVKLFGNWAGDQNRNKD